VNAGISVSRVGGSAQAKIVKKLSGGIKLSLAQFRELAAFAQFASDLDPATRAQLDRGQRVTELMKQKQYAPMSIAELAVSVYAAEQGYLDDLAVDKVLPFEAGLQTFMHQNNAELMQTIVATGKWDKEIEAAFKTALDEYKKTGSW
jgi:F-type H+-transporting ATPase subunit alpha